MSRNQSLKLPVGDIPDWEINGSDSEPPELKSPAESFVILQSLKQSREKWLREMFPKFSSRGRGGKQPDVVPPPHMIYNRGRCTLQIGPHFFMDTTVFEVHYRPLPVSQPAPFVFQPVPANPLSQAPTSTATGESNTPLSSALPVPPGLISQVNAAATSNPAISNLLQLAAASQATPDQLKSLGLLIQSLASSSVTTVPTATSQSVTPGADSSSAPNPTTPVMTPQYQHPTAIKDFDVVLEFREAPSDRWVFPRGHTTYEFISTPGASASIGDLTVSTIVPFPSMTLTPVLPGPEGVPPESTAKQVVEFRFKMANSFIWDTFSRWVGPKEKMEENRKILVATKPPEPKFLAHRLPEGSQLTQIQNAALPSYAMKSIRPLTESGKSRRRPSRRSAQDTPKRKRLAQPKSPAPLPKIACFTCGQANVPLIMGGRYCRPCVEGGQAGETSRPPTEAVDTQTQPDKVS